MTITYYQQRLDILSHSAYELYAGLRKASQTPFTAALFKEAFARKDVSVHFVGVWYEVSDCVCQVIKLIRLKSTR